MSTPAELVAELRGFAEGSTSARATLMRDAADAIESLVIEALIESGRTPLQVARDRAWVQGEMERTRIPADAGPDGYGEGYSDGYHVAMLKVWGRMFLTPDERIEAERVRREMFG